MTKKNTHGVFLKGDRVDLVPTNKDHIKSYTAWLNNHKVRKFNRGVIPITPEQYKKWIEGEESGRVKDSFHLEIWHKKDKKPIGMIGFNHINWMNRNGNIGVFIGEPEYWGRDLCPEVVRLFLKYCFEELNLNKVNAEIFNINKRSYRCAEKSGMKLEGTLKSDAYIDGKYYNSRYYSILKREWNQK